MKLNLKISILVGVLSFLVSMGVGHYANSISSKQLEEKAAQSLIKLSKNVADILDREMLERYREIEFASSLYPLIDENATKEQKREFIEKLKGKHQHHEWIGFAFPDGTVDVGTNGYLEGKNARARPWLPAGLKGPYIGDVHDALLLAKLLPNTSGESIYFTDVAFPVKSKEGKVLGVLCTHLMWQWTRDIIRSIQKEHGVDIFLLANDGLILVGPNDSERKNISDISQNIAKTFNGDKSFYKLINWQEGEKYLTAYTVSNGFEEYKGFGWKVLIREKDNIAFKDVKSNKEEILFLSIVIGIIGAIIGIILANVLVRPLEVLNTKVKAFTKGNNISFKKSASKDEVSTLENTLFELQQSVSSITQLKDIAEDKVQMALKVFEQSLEGIIITDKDNRTILVNKAFSEITGYSQEDMYQKNPSILSSPNQNIDIYKDMWESINTKGKWEGTVTNKKKDGTIYEENLRISTLKDENGVIVNYLATFDSGFNL